MRALSASEYTNATREVPIAAKSFAAALLAWYSCTKLSNACRAG